MCSVTSIGRPITISLVIAVATAGSLPVFAEIEEVIVTAQKREESVQEIPITMSAFDEDALRELGAAGDQQALLGQIPNAQSYLTNSFLQSAHVRGIGLNEFQGQYDSPVAQHMDEVYISKPWQLARPKFDLQRIELLKGPQGTLFGRNTTGGALNYYTNAPTETLEAYLAASYDNYERALIEGAVSGPIAGDLLGRFSFITNFGSGGPQDNLFDGEEHGEPGLVEIRAQLAWTNESTRIRALYHMGVDTSEKGAWKGPGIFNIGGGYCPALLAGDVTDDPETCAKFAGITGDPALEFEPHDKDTINANTPQSGDDEWTGGFLRIEHDVGGATITSITSYEFYERNLEEDSDSSPLRSTDTRYWNQIDTFSQELRLGGTLTDPWRYVLGFFYQHDDLDQVDGSYLGGNPLGIAPPFAPQFFEESQFDVDSIAGFFHTEYDFTDRLRVIAGARYTQDSIKASGIEGLGLDDPTGEEDRVTPCIITTFTPAGQAGPGCPFLAPFLGTPPNGGVFEDNRTDTNVSWRAGFEYDILDQMMLYASLSTGYRSGGYSIPFAGTATQFTPEKLFVQEAGIKSTLLDGSLQANLAVFHYQYDDVQINVDDPVSPVVPITRNIGEQENIGFEADLWWKPTEEWDAKFGVGYLDAEFDEVNISPSTGLPFSITSYGINAPLLGNRPVNSPKWNLNGLVRYQRPIFDGWDLVLMTDVRWTDDRFLEASNLPFDKADSYTVVNARGGVQSQDGTWEISIWGRNIFDEEYLTYINNIPFFKLDIFGEKATFGGNIRYNFQ
ncbi:MAG: TonB-dependent receptor [Gammaproteobacteria bacterium]|nr:TonB-dependent receptor [Gammaproteobacteria bacterium]